ncbi:DUF1963 domain-containing protein [cf. Phormidesmis sp. LEGE 11477]|nr:DUF1963 domain-containing protein [cf. Phormidesmis sp. LEGE 11477]
MPTVPASFDFPKWDTRWHWQSQLHYHLLQEQQGSTKYRSAEINRIRNRLSRDTTVPLTYLGQIYLQELPCLRAECGLPGNGVLLFFYDLVNDPGGYKASSKGAWRCIYLDNRIEQLQPANKDDYGGELFPHCGLCFTEEWMLGIPEFKFEETNQYQIDWGELTTVLEKQFGVKVATVACGVEHRLFGYDGPMQESMERMCQLRFHGIEGYSKQSEPIESGVKDWQLLLQLDSDVSVDWQFGDSGRLYFWIRQQDLQKHDFSKIWFEMQCA